MIIFASISFLFSGKVHRMDANNLELTLVEIMAWCRQATSHYLSQCWPRSMSPYGVTGHNELKHGGLYRMIILYKTFSNVFFFFFDMMNFEWKFMKPIPGCLLIGKSASVQVMALCSQAASHNLHDPWDHMASLVHEINNKQQSAEAGWIIDEIRKVKINCACMKGHIVEPIITWYCTHTFWTLATTASNNGFVPIRC